MSGTSLIGSEGLNQVKAQNEEHMIKGYVRKRNLFFFFAVVSFTLFDFFFFSREGTDPGARMSDNQCKNTKKK